MRPARRNTWLARTAGAAVLCVLALPLAAQDEQPAGLNGGRLDRPRDKQPSRPTPHWPDGHCEPGPAPGRKRRVGGQCRLDASHQCARHRQSPHESADQPEVSEVPFLPWARALYAYRQGTTTKDDPHTQCLPSGGPRLFHTPYGFEFVEVPEEKRIYMIEVGGPHTWRIIYMDGRPHPKNLDPTLLRPFRRPLGRRHAGGGHSWLQRAVLVDA